MEALFWSGATLSFVLWLIRWGSGPPRSLQASEEAAHAAAMDRRRRGAGRQRERGWRFSRPPATARVLGDEKRAPCRIVNTSRSRMRIALKGPFPVGAQVHVEWDGEFFVGTCCYRLAWGEDYLLGLRLLACSYRRIPVGLPFLSSGNLWGTACKVELMRVLQMFAVSRVGTRLRPVLRGVD